ncbi:MAG: efflux RND transporter periplasmic adaptor subunit, partial [Candidatus Binatia bacterium]
MTSQVWRGGSLARFVGKLLLALVIVNDAACDSDYPTAASQPPSTTKAARTLKQVQAVPARTTPLERTVAVLGSLAAHDQATLSVKVPGRVHTIPVDLGSVVEHRQVLAQIEPRDYQLRLEQAEAALAQARALLGLPPQGTNDRVDLEQTGTVRQARAQRDEARRNRDRLQTLAQKGFIATAESEAAGAAYTVAESRYQEALEEVRNRQAVLKQRRVELAIARQQLADTLIRAPFDGVVQERQASIGEYLAAGAPVVTLVRMDPLRLRVEVPEREAPSVQAGQAVRLKVEGDAGVYTGQIRRLSPVLNEQNRMLVVEADVKNTGGLRPGMFVRAEIVTDESGVALTVPTSAIVTFAGIEKVFVVHEGKAVETPVTVGRRADDWTEVLAGVDAGDMVIVEPGSLQS